MMNDITDQIDDIIITIDEIEKKVNSIDDISEDIELLSSKVSDLKNNLLFNLEQEIESEIYSRDLVEKVEINQYLKEYFTTNADPKYISDYLPDVLFKIWNNRNMLEYADVEFLDKIVDKLNGDVKRYNELYKLIE